VPPLSFFEEPSLWSPGNEGKAFLCAAKNPARDGRFPPDGACFNNETEH
ncbi:unnamed protein product, partial [Acidocella sp. C78]